MAVVRAPIVDGRVATEAERHATVALVYTSDGEVWCTGTLVAPRVVVTAAHCVVEQDLNTDAVTRRMEASEIVAIAGPVKARDATEAEVHAIERIALHPGFPNGAPSDDPTGAGRYDDIAVLVLETPVTELTPALIPTADAARASLVPETSLTITGYGTVDADGAGGGVLYIAESPFVRLVDLEIVAGGAGFPDTCPGDSGGPAYLLGGSVAALVGVTSRGSANVDSTCGEGGLYTFAPAYRDWIVRSANGLYSPDVVVPPPPDEACDPATEDCGEPPPEEACDPATEDCGEPQPEVICDPAVEACEAACDPGTGDCDATTSDTGCSGASGAFWSAALFALGRGRRRL
jgi:trypsin